MHYCISLYIMIAEEIIIAVFLFHGDKTITLLHDHRSNTHELRPPAECTVVFGVVNFVVIIIGGFSVLVIFGGGRC